MVHQKRKRYLYPIPHSYGRPQKLVYCLYCLLPRFVETINSNSLLLTMYILTYSSGLQPFVFHQFFTFYSWIHSATNIELSVKLRYWYCQCKDKNFHIANIMFFWNRADCLRPWVQGWVQDSHVLMPESRYWNSADCIRPWVQGWVQDSHALMPESSKSIPPWAELTGLEPVAALAILSEIKEVVSGNIIRIKLDRIFDYFLNSSWRRADPNQL